MATAVGKALNPAELKIVFEALHMAPSYLSRRFILRELLGWSDELIEINAKLRMEESNAEKTGNKIGAFK